MSEDVQDAKSSVDWGKLGKNILAGAAIAAGALIVLPVIGEGVVTLLGIAIAAAGAAYLIKGTEKRELSPEQQGAEYAKRSFAAEQDIRRMQAIMTERMQAQEYPPAMAMANQPAR